MYFRLPLVLHTQLQLNNRPIDSRRYLEMVCFPTGWRWEIEAPDEYLCVYS